MPKSDRNPLVHGSNLEQKENHRTKYRDVESKKYLTEIRTEYDTWRSANLELVGPTSTPTDQDDAIIATLGINGQIFDLSKLNEYGNFSQMI